MGNRLMQISCKANWMVKLATELPAEHICIRNISCHDITIQRKRINADQQSAIDFYKETKIVTTNEFRIMHAATERLIFLSPSLTQ